MSTSLILILSGLVLFIAVIVFNYYRMKNKKPVVDSKKIIKLTPKNMKPATRKGLVLVDFWASWCAPCKLIAPILNEIAEEESEKVTIAKVNVEHQQQLASKFKVKNIPTLVLLQDGKEINRFVGMKTKKFLKKEIYAVSS